MVPRRPLLTYLPLAGTLPFVCGAALALGGYEQLPPPFPAGLSVVAIVAFYALAILSFMAGVHWGQYVAHAHTSAAILITSNFVTVSGWLGLLVLSPANFLIMAGALFVVLLTVDWQLAQTAAISPTYFRIRFIVTAIVVSALLIVALS